MDYLALDVGGANLKIADGNRFALSHSFPLWRTPERLAHALRTLLAEAPRYDRLVATMTGELADCFATKAEGVRFIVWAIAEAAGDRHLRIYLTDGSLRPLELLLDKNRLLAAASNWHALATFAGRYVGHGSGLLIDVGSTTCDIIPLVDAKPAAVGKTDTQRLISGELVYTGVERTPICAVVDRVPYRDQTCPLAREWFATMGDAYLILDDLSEEPTDTSTADGRPATKAAARDRLARLICADREMFDHSDAAALATVASRAQLASLEPAMRRAIDRLPSRPDAVVLSGSGEFLARRLIERLGLSVRLIALSEELGPVVSRCAPAHALAVLAREAAD